jgi:hypothetical protein
MKYFVKDLGVLVEYGVEGGGTITKTKLELFDGSDALVQIVGVKDATKLVSDLDASLLVGTNFSKMCGKTDSKAGDIIKYMGAVVYSTDVEWNCRDYTSKIWTVGRATYQRKAVEQVTTILYDKYLPKQWRLFDISFYDLSTQAYDVYLSVEGGESFYCSWDNIKNKDFKGAYDNTVKYYKGYFSSKEKFQEWKEKFDANVVNQKAVKGLLTGTPNKEYKDYINTQTQKKLDNVDETMAKLEHDYKLELLRCEEEKRLWQGLSLDC